MKINEMWGKDNQGNWITKYCKGINFVYVPGFAKIENNKPFGLYSSTICESNNYNIVDAVYLHNYTFTYLRWTKKEQDINRGKKPEEFIEISIDEKYFTLPPRANIESYYRYDYPSAACIIAHEFGHCLLGKAHTNKKNNLMFDNDITTVCNSLQLGKSDLFTLEKEQIKKSRERAECIQKLIGLK